MIIKALVTNVAADEPYEKEFVVDISEQATLQDLLNKLECGLADVSDYYEFSGPFAWNNFFCPFVLTASGIQFNLPYTDVKLSDFINTHSINSKAIRIVTGYPQAGGPGFIELAEIWNTVQPWLNDIAILLTISGFNIKDTVKWIRSLFDKKKVPPHTVIDMLSTRSQWNHKELALILELPEENAQNLLKAFGYKYDRSLMQYIPGDETQKLREKLKSVQIYDI